MLKLVHYPLLDCLPSVLGLVIAAGAIFMCKNKKLGSVTRQRGGKSKKPLAGSSLAPSKTQTTLSSTCESDAKTAIATADSGVEKKSVATATPKKGVKKKKVDGKHKKNHRTSKKHKHKSNDEVKKKKKKTIEKKKTKESKTKTQEERKKTKEEEKEVRRVLTAKKEEKRVDATQDMNEDQESDSNAKKQISEDQKEVEQPPTLKRKPSRLRFSAILRKSHSEVDKKKTLRSRKEAKSPSVKNTKARKTQVPLENMATPTIPRQRSLRRCNEGPLDASRLPVERSELCSVSSGQSPVLPVEATGRGPVDDLDQLGKDFAFLSQKLRTSKGGASINYLLKGNRLTMEGDNVEALEGNKAQTPNSLKTIEVDNRLKSLVQWQAQF